MLALWLAATLTLTQPVSTDRRQAENTYLYRALLLRAAPGELLTVIDLLRERSSVYETADGRPIMMRHRQGDQWDLLLIFPMGSFADYYAPERVARRERAAGASGLSDAAFTRRLTASIAWREEVYVHGPVPENVYQVTDAGELYHVEMFIALPGKRRELRREREMENVYLAELDRPRNLIFTRVAGAAWDLFTVGVYRDFPHFAASDTISAERSGRAAQVAGFEAPSRIGPYLRTLIATHHDTLAGRVRP